MNLQFRFGVDDRFVGKHQVFVGLLGVGLLRVLADDNAAIEDRAGAAVQNAFVELVAAGVRLGVVDGGVIVDVLGAVDDIEAVDVGVCAFGENRIHVVANQRTTQGNRVR